MVDQVRFDWLREDRTGVPEAVYSENKSTAQLAQIVAQAQARGRPLLFTRLSAEAHNDLVAASDAVLDYDPISRTAFLGKPPAPALSGLVAIVCAGSADIPAAHEAQRALEFFGAPAPVYADVGVAGLWRLLEVAEELRRFHAIIAVAGMEGALFSVVGGLVPGLVVAVPTSVGYGVSQDGKAALSSALATCAPGVVTVNIDNGFGAAASVAKLLRRQASFCSEAQPS